MMPSKTPRVLRINITNKRVLLLTPILNAMAENGLQFNQSVMSKNTLSFKIARVMEKMAANARVVRNDKGQPIVADNADPFHYFNCVVTLDSNNVFTDIKYRQINSDIDVVKFEVHDIHGKVLPDWTRYYYPKAYLNKMFVSQNGKSRVYRFRENVGTDVPFVLMANDQTSNMFTKSLGFKINESLHITNSAINFSKWMEDFGSYTNEL